MGKTTNNSMIKVGDVVVLKSGGPLMTVQSIDSNLCLCIWIQAGLDPQQVRVPPACLRRQKPTAA